MCSDLAPLRRSAYVMYSRITVYREREREREGSFRAKTRSVGKKFAREDSLKGSRTHPHLSPSADVECITKIETIGCSDRSIEISIYARKNNYIKKDLAKTTADTLRQAYFIVDINYVHRTQKNPWPTTEPVPPLNITSIVTHCNISCWTSRS